MTYYRFWMAKKVRKRKSTRKRKPARKKKFPSHHKGLPANHEKAHKRMQRARNIADRQQLMAYAEQALVVTVGKRRAVTILKKFPLHSASDVPFILGLVEGWKRRGRVRVP